MYSRSNVPKSDKTVVKVYSYVSLRSLRGERVKIAQKDVKGNCVSAMILQYLDTSRGY